MNTILKNVIMVTVPTIIGVIGSHLITKKIISAKYEAEMELKVKDEIEKFKKDYSEKMQNEPRRIPVSQLTKEQKERARYFIERDENRRISLARDVEEEAKEMKKEQDDNLENLYPMENDIGDDTDSDGEELYDEDGNVLGDPNDDYEDDVEMVEYKEEDEIPFVISQEEYDTDKKYAKTSLMYYEDDKILTNENDYILDINEIIGEKSIEHFGDMSGDPTIVYVRNISLDSDYEVQLVHGSFKHLVGDLK